MTTLREAAEMALAALDSCSGEETYAGEWVDYYDQDLVRDAKEALRQALASEQAMDVLIFTSQEMGAYDNLVQEIKLYDDGIKPKEKNA